MKLAVGVALAALLATAGDLAVGGEVPDLAFKGVDGKGDKLSDLNKAGKIVVIVSWSRDCPSSALARFEEVVAQYKDNAKVAFVGVSAFGDTAEGISSYLKDKNPGYTVVADTDKAVSKVLGARKVNATYVVVGGKLFYRGGCMRNGKDKVVDAIEAALGGKKAPPSDKDKLG